MSTEENKRLAREAIRIWTTGNLGAADDVYAPDYVKSTSITTLGIPGIFMVSRR